MTIYSTTKLTKLKKIVLNHKYHQILLRCKRQTMCEILKEIQLNH